MTNVRILLEIKTTSYHFRAFIYSFLFEREMIDMVGRHNETDKESGKQRQIYREKETDRDKQRKTETDKDRDADEPVLALPAACGDERLPHPARRVAHVAGTQVLQPGGVAEHSEGSYVIELSSLITIYLHNIC